jgi:hypothetical protein
MAKIQIGYSGKEDDNYGKVYDRVFRKPFRVKLLQKIDKLLVYLFLEEGDKDEGRKVR